MDTIHKLTEYFREFPGIGPRQAKRFVYFLLTRNEGYLREFTRLVGELKNQIAVCDSCQRYFPLGRINLTVCAICADTKRDASSLMIVSRDVDYENIEKSHSYNGYYFILGGTIPILEKNPEQKIRQNELLSTIEKRIPKEIILAMSLNPEGENTEDYLRSLLSPLTQLHNIKISTLGRGLSTGTELEYSDSETLKNALQNRH